MKMKNFPELLKQLNSGLINEMEFILQMQLSEKQVVWLLAAQQLPPNATKWITLTDFEHDDSVEVCDSIIV